MTLPDNCMGQEISMRCIYDEDTGQSLTSILAALKPATTAAPKQITSDDIVSKSLVRNKSNICAANIVKRDFTYSQTLSGNSVLVSWDFWPVINELPAGYKTAVIGVEINGVGDNNNLASSKSPSAGLSVFASSFPVIIDANIRLTTPCGNVDLSTKIHLRNPAEVGTFRTTLNADDLNPQSSQIKLTTQLNELEAAITSLTLKQNAYLEQIEQLMLELEELKQA